MTEFTISNDFPRSEIEFDARFSKPEACYEYILKHKWPDGFVCSKYENHQYWLNSRKLYICTNCEYQHSLTSGTIMEGTKNRLHTGSKPCGGLQPVKAV